MDLNPLTRRVATGRIEVSSGGLAGWVRLGYGP